ncbi:hypothetical protein CU097_009882 [Rhizopus azygosporus]|uniref:Uncharacterized protein n=1 Tax=Rhizopus azygosporus TaxID=86630 RepID=A0A367JG44_RHIAZ|nr:hypothetical protein CU097_009882 [Rhizopus azygosporus]
MKFYSQAFDVFLNYSETQVFSLSVFNIIYDETWRTPLRYYDAYTRPRNWSEFSQFPTYHTAALTDPPFGRVSHTSVAIVIVLFAAHPVRNVGYRLLQNIIPCRDTLYRILPQYFPEDACVFYGELILLIILYRVALRNSLYVSQFGTVTFLPHLSPIDSFERSFISHFPSKPFTGSSPDPSIIIGAILITSWQSH